MPAPLRAALSDRMTPRPPRRPRIPDETGGADRGSGAPCAGSPRNAAEPPTAGTAVTPGRDRGPAQPGPACADPPSTDRPPHPATDADHPCRPPPPGPTHRPEPPPLPTPPSSSWSKYSGEREGQRPSPGSDRRNRSEIPRSGPGEPRSIMPDAHIPRATPTTGLRVFPGQGFPGPRISRAEDPGGAEAAGQRPRGHAQSPRCGQDRGAAHPPAAPAPPETRAPRSHRLPSSRALQPSSPHPPRRRPDRMRVPCPRKRSASPRRRMDATAPAAGLPARRSFVITHGNRVITEGSFSLPLAKSQFFQVSACALTGPRRQGSRGRQA